MKFIKRAFRFAWPENREPSMEDNYRVTHWWVNERRYATLLGIIGLAVNVAFKVFG